uniref:Uncharacterized protein n=1 Tax=Brassica oleracea TaxID=3712 RepID=A0A3P6AC19_BRAOL|nr:unnamed protein product [Brassica oleracea]
MSLYQVLEYQIEFLEAFGCIWSSKEVDMERSLAFLSDPLRSLPKSGATHQGRSCPLVRRHQNRASWSDLSERPARATSSSRSRFDGARHEETRRE